MSALADWHLTPDQPRAELDRGGVVIDFPKQSVPTASSSGTIVDTTFGAVEAKRSPTTMDAAAYEALWTVSNAVSSDAYKWVTTANDFYRTNVAGMRVHFAPETLLNETNDILWSGYVGAFGEPVATTSELWFDPLAFAPVNVDREGAYRRAVVQLGNTRDALLSEYSAVLDVAAAPHSQAEPKDVVDALTREYGVSQLVIAQALGVTATAVRKWRRGETATPSNRGRLARFAALVELLDDAEVHDPAGWLGIPVSDRSTLRPLDMFVAGRPELVLLLASRIDEPRTVLDLFDPSWADTYSVDEEYEVVQHGDGSRSAVPRRV